MGRVRPAGETAKEIGFFFGVGMSRSRPLTARHGLHYKLPADLKSLSRTSHSLSFSLLPFFSRSGASAARAALMHSRVRVLRHVLPGSVFNSTGLDYDTPDSVSPNNTATRSSPFIPRRELVETTTFFLSLLSPPKIARVCRVRSDGSHLSSPSEIVPFGNQHGS